MLVRRLEKAMNALEYEVPTVRNELIVDLLHAQVLDFVVDLSDIVQLVNDEVLHEGFVDFGARLKAEHALTNTPDFVVRAAALTIDLRALRQSLQVVHPDLEYANFLHFVDDLAVVALDELIDARDLHEVALEGNGLLADEELLLVCHVLLD